MEQVVIDKYQLRASTGVSANYAMENRDKKTLKRVWQLTDFLRNNGPQLKGP